MPESLQFKRAGAFLGGKNFKANVPDILREYETENLEVKMHKDCGAIKLVHGAASGSRQIDNHAVYEALVPPFLRRMGFNPKSATRENIEDIGKIIQMGIAVKWTDMPSLKNVSCEVNLSHGEVEGSKTLLLTSPIIEWAPLRTAVVTCMDPRCKTREGGFDRLAESLELNPNTTYIITIVKGDPRQTAIDPIAAVRYIGIRNVVLFAGANDKDHAIDAFHMAIRRKEIWLPGADIKRYD